MGKLIFAILLGILLYLWLKGRRGKGRAARPAEPVRQAEAMGECAICRLHVPKSEGIEGDGRFYCCEEHRRLGGR